jgi:predicted ATPase
MEKQIGLRCVITGGVGSGKTTLVDNLGKIDRIWTADEQALNIIRKELESGGKLLPWSAPSEFWKPVTASRIIQFREAPIQTHDCVFDRGIPEPLAFLKIEGIGAPKELITFSQQYRYDAIFWTPPWKEIYRTTVERPWSWDYAEKLGTMLKDAYESVGYKVVEIPKDTIEIRTNFVLDNMDRLKRK